MSQIKTYKVKHVKTGEIREVGESVANDSQSLTAQGYMLLGQTPVAQQPKPEKKSVSPAVEDESEIQMPEFKDDSDDPELPKEIKAKRKYTKKK